MLVSLSHFIDAIDENLIKLAVRGGKSYLGKGGGREVTDLGEKKLR